MKSEASKVRKTGVEGNQLSGEYGCGVSETEVSDGALDRILLWIPI